jgi:hypothetical protein
VNKTDIQTSAQSYNQRSVVLLAIMNLMIQFLMAIYMLSTNFGIAQPVLGIAGINKKLISKL